MFSVTQFGKELDNSKYTWNEENKIFSTKENNLVLDFSYYNGVAFRTGFFCTFKTSHHCTFETLDNCVFYTGDCCKFHTHACCVFKTGSFCEFYTGAKCAFYTAENCIFKTGSSCSIIRVDVEGVIEIPNKAIELNGRSISGYTEFTKIEEIKKANDGKIAVIDGKKYKLQIID